MHLTEAVSLQSTAVEKPKREGEIPQQLRQLTQQTEQLTTLLQKLQERLVPVTRSEVQQESGGDCQAPACGLAAMLNGQVQKIEVSNELLTSLLDRLEL